MPIYALGEHVPVIDPTAFVHPDAVLIGNVVIGPESSVWPNAVLRGDGAGIRVGARSSVQDGTVVHNTPELQTIVGDDCTVGHLAHLEGCTIENAALVGSGSVVLHRAVIGTGALVGANAVVIGDTIVPPLAMALGVPAKIRENAMAEGQNLPDAATYVDRAARFLAEMRLIG